MIVASGCSKIGRGGKWSSALGSLIRLYRRNAGLVLNGSQRVLVRQGLRSDEAGAQKIGVPAGIPVLGLDALASAAYGPEAALTVLLPLGLAGLVYIVPISLAIVALLLIVQFSCRQTIAAYPS